jgi:Fe-S cluster assembly protein SufB
VKQISQHKNEPAWMLDFRLRAFDIFQNKQMPMWGADLSDIDFNNIFYYLKPTKKQVNSWEDLPPDIKDTYDRIGIPEAEKRFLAGVSAQYESEVVYKSIKKELDKQGVIFLDMDSGLREHPDIVEEYFGKIIPPGDNKFAALNSAVWSGGSFVYVPKGIEVKLPLQAYFRINAANMGQFERTLIIAEEGSFVHYVEGCTAPIYTTDSLHAAVVEIFVKKGARVRYTTIQNWSTNVYNLVTKRMRVEEDGVGEWVDGNLGSKVTMKYPSVYLVGQRARGEILSIAYAGNGQHQDAGGKAMHLSPNTSSKITSKSISKGKGRTSYRGMVHVSRMAKNSKSKVVCDALLLDEHSRSDTYPTMDIQSQDTQIEHEATVSKIGEEQLFYLESRGLKKEVAEALIVNGFIEPIVKELPLEYAVEMNRLIELQMEGSVG